MVRDTNLFFRTAADGNLTATETSPALKVQETPIGGLSLNALVPVESISDSLSIPWFESTDGEDYVLAGFLEEVQTGTEGSTVPALYRTRIVSNGWYLRVEFRTAGTSPNFGAVECWLGDSEYMNNLTTGVPETLHTV